MCVLVIVFALKTTQNDGVDGDDKKDSKNRFLYALSPPVSTSEEGENRDHNSILFSMQEQTVWAVWRDLIKSRDTQQLQECVQSAQDLIVTGDQTAQEWNDRWARYQTPTTDVGARTVSRIGGTHTASASMAHKRKTAMSASTFFGSSSSSSSMVKNKATKSTNNSHGRDGNANNEENMTDNHSATTGRGSSSRTLKPQPRTGTTIKKQLQVVKEKENNNKQQYKPPQKTSLTKQAGGKAQHNQSGQEDVVGNADDFVGDIEEEEDAPSKPVEVAAKPKKRSHQHEPTGRENDSARKNSKKDEQDDMDVVMVDVCESDGGKRGGKGGVEKRSTEEDEERVDGNADSSSTKRRARRKKWVPKTTMDSSGYLHTQMQEVWEEIPSDEEVQLIKNKPKRAIIDKKKPAKKGSKLKQGSLSAFFKK